MLFAAQNHDLVRIWILNEAARISVEISYKKRSKIIAAPTLSNCWHDVSTFVFIWTIISEIWYILWICGPGTGRSARFTDSINIPVTSKIGDFITNFYVKKHVRSSNGNGVAMGLDFWFWQFFQSISTMSRENKFQIILSSCQLQCLAAIIASLKSTLRITLQINIYQTSFAWLGTLGTF